MYHVIVIYVVHNRQIISPGVFCIFFQNFDFLGCYRGKRLNKSRRWQKILSVGHTPYVRTIYDMIVIYGTHVYIYGTHVYNDRCVHMYFSFFKILSFWVIRGVKGQKMVQNDKKLCWSCSISQESYTMIVIFGSRL